MKKFLGISIKFIPLDKITLVGPVLPNGINIIWSSPLQLIFYWQLVQFVWTLFIYGSLYWMISLSDFIQAIILVLSHTKEWNDLLSSIVYVSKKVKLFIFIYKSDTDVNRYFHQVHLVVQKQVKQDAQDQVVKFFISYLLLLTNHHETAMVFIPTFP